MRKVIMLVLSLALFGYGAHAEGGFGNSNKLRMRANASTNEAASASPSAQSSDARAQLGTPEITADDQGTMIGNAKKLGMRAGSIKLGRPAADMRESARAQMNTAATSDPGAIQDEKPASFGVTRRLEQRANH